ncbi:PQQ-dependent sugar dehydrogenase [Oceaniglobus trochenteri]|uniref:PQQ-dependent sugar dehydrogenase n=1 Tax=Oceaniglobus trochenteri TaxID=2763260 RepID=UPI001CFF8212|nr:PQQ-dependent sugar dehydrogenase [Oceaniglobus trochenteri]
MRTRICATLLALACLSPLASAAMDSSLGAIEVAPVVTGLNEPWGFAFLPGGGFLVTERAGRLQHVGADGSVKQVSGLPDVHVEGQGGLLDVMVPRDFAETREVFLSYAKKQGGGAGTALAVGRLSQAGDRLEDVKVIFEMAPGSDGGRHFGSRIVEGRDGHLFLTIGDRGTGPQAQNTASHNGSVVRINRDGSVPADNPFVGQENALPEIWSYGHRNPQGAGLDGAGQLWVVEHGAKGGDEVNRVKKGANFGWPVISYGTHYSGQQIGEGTQKPGMAQPAHYWDPSIAPSGMTFYSGRLWPEWKGDLLVGSLKFDMISRLDGDTMKEEERLKSPETARVRDIREAPDGTIWFLAVGKGTLYRMSPR